MYPMGNISVKLGLEQLVSSNPRPHQNLIHFDLSKLAKRPVLGRQNKSFQLAQSGCQALRAPHHAGLFAMGS